MATLEAHHHTTAEQLDRLHMLLMQVETWKVQVDLASNQLGMVLGVLEKEHAGVRFRLDETHAWVEDVAARCERANQTSSALSSVMQQTQQQQAACLEVVGKLTADVQWLMENSGGGGGGGHLQPSWARKRLRTDRVVSFPLLLESSDDDDDDDVEKEQEAEVHVVSDTIPKQPKQGLPTSSTVEHDDDWGPMLATAVAASEDDLQGGRAWRAALVEQQVATRALQQQTQQQADHIARYVLYAL